MVSPIQVWGVERLPHGFPSLAGHFILDQHFAHDGGQDKAIGLLHVAAPCSSSHGLAAEKVSRLTKDFSATTYQHGPNMLLIA